MASAVDLHRAAHDAFSKRDWDGLRALMASDITYVDHPRGLTLNGVDEFIGWLNEWVGGMSDARVADPGYLDAETESVSRFRGRGTNDGRLGPADATGRSLDLAMCEIMRSDGERLIAGEIYYDAMTMMAQFGVIEAPATA